MTIDRRNTELPLQFRVGSEGVESEHIYRESSTLLCNENRQQYIVCTSAIKVYIYTVYTLVYNNYYM